MIDKEKFRNDLKNKNYTECINILRKEIINNLCEEIKKYDKFFSYSTTKDLYIKSKSVLSKEYINKAYILYNIDIMDDSEEYILNQLMEICENFNNKNV